VEISMTVPRRKLVEILRDTAKALEHSLDDIPEDKLDGKGAPRGDASAWFRMLRQRFSLLSCRTQ
jgi:hypothetical protein